MSCLPFRCLPNTARTYETLHMSLLDFGKLFLHLEKLEQATPLPWCITHIEENDLIFYVSY